LKQTSNINDTKFYQQKSPKMAQHSEDAWAQRWPSLPLYTFAGAAFGMSPYTTMMQAMLSGV
jgi:hypothetical protein